MSKYASASYIYALVDPRSQMIRYMGKSINPERRLEEHLRSKSLLRNTAKARWLNELVASGLSPRIAILEEVTRGRSTHAENKWLNRLQNRGIDLLNDCQHKAAASTQDRKRRAIVYRMRGEKRIADVLECGHAVVRAHNDYTPSESGYRMCADCA